MAPGDPEDREERDVCANCGARVALESERAFGFGAGNVLCGKCAIERGGRYDAGRDTWDVPPDLAGLADEAYGAAPHEVRRERR
jgi:hypothetical protein